MILMVFFISIKEINRLLSNVSDIYLKVTIEENGHSQNSIL